LWKLNPANEGKLEPIPDYPRVQYNDIKQSDKSGVFIRAEFETDAAAARELAGLSGLAAENFSLIRFERRFDEKYQITFPRASVQHEVSSAGLLEVLAAAKNDIESDSSDAIVQGTLLGAIKASTEIVQSGGGKVTASLAQKMLAKVNEATVEDAASALGRRWTALLASVQATADQLGLTHPDYNEKARKAALKHLPSFVYYSNYGNLDSEIYLPHVIENLKRDDLGTKETAKARTLRVLFKFVGLEPQQILELGKAATAANGKKPSDEEIAQAAERTKERRLSSHISGCAA
jgi:hypothetical protein